MKWIGQNIYDQISKFRGADGSSVTIDSNSTEPLVIYQPVVDANPKILIGSSSTERLMIRPFYGSGTQTLQTVFFKTTTASGVANYGAFRFNVDATNILDIDDGGIDLDTNMGISINGTDILTDSSGTATLSNIDALDATTISTLNSALTAGDITGVTAGTGLNGGGTSGAVTLNVDAHQDLTSVIFGGNQTVTPGDGAALHIDNAEITDGNTSASATTAKYTHARIERPRLHATNASVTTTDAATLYIDGAPIVGTNQTLTNAYALWVDDGLVKFDGALTVGGTITGDVTGDISGQAGTVATIAGLAPNTATTQATQNAITTLGGVTSIGATTMAITSAAVDQYKATNDGNPAYSIGSSNTNELIIQSVYHSGAQTLENVLFRTETTSGTADDGKMIFQVDAFATLQIDDGGIDFAANHGISIAGTDILTDSSGTATLSNIDALDATTKTTIATTADAATATTTGVVELATTAEATTGTDTARAVTAAGVTAHVDDRYQYVFINHFGNATKSDMSGDDWLFPKDGQSWESYDYDDLTDTVANEATTFTLPRASQGKGIIVPYDCILEGMYGSMASSENDQGALALWTFTPAWGVGGTGGVTATRRMYAAGSLEGATSSYTGRPAKIYALGGTTANVDTPVALTAGDSILPALVCPVDGATANIKCSFTIVLKVKLPDL